jgi:hypothetical protein
MPILHCWRPPTPSFGCFAVLLLVVGGVVQAASPHVSQIDPPGVQRGVETEITISGERLKDARGLLFYSPGMEVLSLQADDAGKVRARLRAAPDCPLGEHDVRLWTDSGISELIPLYAGPFPNIACSGSNHDVAHAQAVPVNSTVNGIIHDEEIDYFSIQAKKGDRITSEVEGMRLGREMFDPWTAIMDANGRQLAANDDNPLLLQDPLVSMIAPADGAYLVAVRESTWGGSARSAYRLHIGTYPQPVAVYPPGGPAGEKLSVTFLGDAKGAIPSSVQLPAVTSVPFAAAAYDNDLVAPAPLPMRVSPFPNVLEQEPNDDVAHATPASQPPPIAFNGIIQQPGDRDFFRFHATRGAVLDMTVYARQLRSPLDSVLDVWDSKGGHITGNDDSIGPDSYLRVNVPADGDYCISVRDHLNRGGPTFVYRVEVVPVGSEVSFTVPEVVRNSQERQTIVVPRGNRFATMLRVKRESFDGDFQVNLPGLLPGVTLQSGSLAGDLLPVVFQAAPDGAIGATLSDVLAQPVDPAKHVAGGYAQTIELVHGPPNDYAYVKTAINRLAISVAEEAPFRIELATPVVPILQDGPATLKVTAVRKAGFTGPINVSMLYNPPGVNSQATVTIPEKQDSVDLPINASGDARPKTWQIAVIGSADAGQGTVWASSALVPLTVSKPFITGHLDRASAVQGQPVAITCRLDQNVSFEGKATIRLMGLPNKVTAPDVEVTSADKQAVFNVTTDPTSPPGQHRDLFCQVTVTGSNAQQSANTSFGGILRIDQLTPKKEVASK